MTPLWAITMGGVVSLIAIAVLYHLTLQGHAPDLEPDDSDKIIAYLKSDNDNLRRALEAVKFNSSPVSTVYRICDDALQGRGP